MMLALDLPERDCLYQVKVLNLASVPEQLLAYVYHFPFVVDELLMDLFR